MTRLCVTLAAVVLQDLRRGCKTPRYIRCVGACTYKWWFGWLSQCKVCFEDHDFRLITYLRYFGHPGYFLLPLGVIITLFSLPLSKYGIEIAFSSYFKHTLVAHILVPLEWTKPQRRVHSILSQASQTPQRIKEIFHQILSELAPKVGPCFSRTALVILPLLRWYTDTYTIFYKLACPNEVIEKARVR